jgi:hypothetical protein
VNAGARRLEEYPGRAAVKPGMGLGTDVRNTRPTFAIFASEKANEDFSKEAGR